MSEDKIICHTEIQSAQYKVIEESENYYIASSPYHDDGEAKAIKKASYWVAHTEIS